MKAESVLLTGAILSMVIIGLATLNNLLLALSLPLIVYLLAAIYSRPEELQIMVRREISPEQGFQGTPIDIMLRIENGANALDEFMVEDQPPEGMRKISGESSLTAFLPAGGMLTLDYRAEANRGSYRHADTAITARDFSGFFETVSKLRSEVGLIIHPRYAKIDRIKIRPPQTRGFAGPISARQGGSGIDFFGIREYQSGDPERRINWKITSRQDEKLFTTVFEQERVADVGILLDARQRLNTLTAVGSLFEYSVQAAAGLAENFLDDGNRVSLLVFGSSIRRVFPGYGRIQRDRILKALAGAAPGMNYALGSLANLPTRFFPAKSQVVFVSPLTRDDIPVLTQMHVHGYAVLVISPDPLSFEGRAWLDKSGFAYRIAHAERILVLEELRRSGVQVIDWDVSLPLNTVIHDALARQPYLFLRRPGV